MASDDKLPWGLSSKGLTPGSLKNITDTKLKAFNVGSMNIKKVLTKKEQDELRKKREEEETAEVYQDFVESFDDAKKGLKKAWVKGGVVNPEKGEIASEKSDNRLYRPTSKLLEKKLGSTSKDEKKKEEKVEKPNLSKKKIAGPEKRKTNLELFKEELKVIQEERQERRKVKQELGIIQDPEQNSKLDELESVASGASMGIKGAAVADDYRMGSYTYENDVQTTNLYLGNINPKMTEMQLCEVFGKFGPLASVKVMWPRTDEERARGRNCGFVAYMNRKDGERALAALQGKDIQDFEMKLGWGKSVPIPPHPVYIPPALSELTLPPPPSGLPFNAQVNNRAAPTSTSQYGSVPPPAEGQWQDNGQQQMKDPALMTTEELDKTLANAVVKVVIPTERVLLNTIHRMIEFVVREGPMFEAMIMNHELQNPLYRFLFENQSPAHIYYRWKLFSILQGDSPYKWRMEVFRMFKGGSLWRPPQMNPYTQGMPEELIEDGSESADKQDEFIPSLLDDIQFKPGGGLTESQRDRLEDLLRELLPERARIGDAMVWCLEHAESAEEIVECIAESLSILQTPIPKKIARLFLISDILHNCSARVSHASFFRKHFETKLPEIFKDIHEAYDKIGARLKAEQFKQRVMACFRAWEDWCVYPSDFLINLQNIFLGLVATKESTSPSRLKDEDPDESIADDVDGVPLEDIDGAPLMDESGVKSKSIVPYVDDIDGEPVDDESTKKSIKPELKFIPSKWETVDESELESQAMTVSKWDLLDQKNKQEQQKSMSQQNNDNVDADYDIDGRPMDDNDNDDDDVMIMGKTMNESLKSSWGQGTPAHIDLSSLRDDDVVMRNELTEQKRAKLREIELTVMKYQDELEAGKRSRKPGMTIAEQVEQYRRKQLSKQEEKERPTKDGDRRRDRSREYERSSKRRSEDRSPPRKERSSLGGGGAGGGRDERRHRGDSPPLDRSKGGEGGLRYSRGGEERMGRRDRSYSPLHATEYNRGYSTTSSMGSMSGLVSYTRSQSSDSVSDDDRTERRVRRGSPKRSSRGGSPVRSKRSRSRSPSSRHKHKKSKR